MPLRRRLTPRVLGVEDFALYGDTYGTLLVDASTRLPLTLWEGRDAEQLSRWLREHPGVEVACRDGSLTYRQGVAGGAPGAVQVRPFPLLAGNHPPRPGHHFHPPRLSVGGPHSA